MKLKRERIAVLSRIIIEGLTRNGFIVSSIPEEELLKKIQHIITEELMIEDRINEEVREILKTYSKQIEQSSVNYQKMFQMIKNKLIKERGTII